MPSRLKRYQSEGHYHFLTFSCHGRLPYLNDEHSRTTFLHTLETLRLRHQFLVFGYVLMPEHVHLLLSEPKLQRLDNTLRVLKGQTSKLLKGPRPHFWLDRYYDFNVLTHAKYVEKLRYIHRNPVERGLVKKPEDWRWSSYRHHLTGEPGPVEIESHWTFTRRERSTTPLTACNRGEWGPQPHPPHPELTSNLLNTFRVPHSCAPFAHEWGPQTPGESPSAKTACQALSTSPPPTTRTKQTVWPRNKVDRLVSPTRLYLK